MDLSSLLQWWDEWQLSVLVLGSLGVKCFLAVAAAGRKSYKGPVYRSLVWLAYLGGDALAIYALAALLNIQKKAAQAHESSAAATDRGSRALQLLWAPIMLMHLGGLTNISAYNIEDNELWRRHIATSVSQVAVALYVFCKLWSSSADKRLLAAAILLFIPGVFKCFDKPLALRRSSFYNLVSQRPKKENRQQNKSPDPEPSLENYIKDAKKAASDGLAGVDDKGLKNSRTGWECMKRLSRPDKLFVDLARPYSERARAAESFWDLKDGTDQTVIGIGISNTFNLLYTKDFTLAKKGRDESHLDLMCSLSTWVLCLLVPIAAIGLLHSGRTEAYRGSDVKITFVLLYLTLFVDACSIFSLDESRPWHGKVAQHNLMALFAHNRWRRPWLARAAKLLGCAELLDHLFFRMEPCNSSTQQQGRAGGITSEVRHHIKKAWKEYIDDKDPESYSRFSDMRGQWTLQHEECKKDLVGSLALGSPFDEAVLVWHLATDLCQQMSLGKSKTVAGPSSPSPPDPNATLAKQISNYMMHLLFSNPEMLMPGSRTQLCTLAYNEMEAIFENAADKQKEEEKKADKKEEEEEEEEEENTAAAVVVERLLHHADSSGDKGGFVYAAWKLACALEGLGDKKKAWRVIRGVWVEMLCFSAIRCRGYLHAKSLGSGGEYLTFVWLLMAHAGLETFPERQQRPLPPPPSDSDEPAAAPGAAQSSAPHED